jgi:hypothetical protein
MAKTTLKTNHGDTVRIDLSHMEKSLTKADRATLQLCIDLALAEPGRADIVKDKLREDWAEAAMYACHYLQSTNMGLVAETPPCMIVDPDASLKGPNNIAWYWGEHAAARLVKKLQAVGISRYHPDPGRALEATITI